MELDRRAGIIRIIYGTVCVQSLNASKGGIKNNNRKTQLESANSFFMILCILYTALLILLLLFYVVRDLRAVFRFRSAADAKCIKRTWLGRVFPVPRVRPVRRRLTAHAPVIVVISDEERPLK
jgi:hypothetical protein